MSPLFRPRNQPANRSETRRNPAEQFPEPQHSRLARHDIRPTSPDWSDTQASDLSNQPRPEGVALGRPARAGRARREAPVGGDHVGGPLVVRPPYTSGRAHVVPTRTTPASGCIDKTQHLSRLTVLTLESVPRKLRPVIWRSYKRARWIRTAALLRAGGVHIRRIAPKLFGSHGQRPWI